MAKETIHVGLACETSSYLPGEGGMISLAAAIGEDTFQVNFAGDWQPSRQWKKHPKKWEAMLQGQVPEKEGTLAFRDWLKRYSGRFVAICSPLEFYWVFHLMVAHTRGCPFGVEGMLDSRTILLGRKGDFALTGGMPAEPTELLAAAKSRAVLPAGGQKKSTFFLNSLRHENGDFRLAQEPIRVQAPPRWQPAVRVANWNANIQDALAQIAQRQRERQAAQPQAPQEGLE